MNNINYTGKWVLDLSNMIEAEWDQLVSVFRNKGVKMYSSEFDTSLTYLYPSSTSDHLVRGSRKPDATLVSLLQMLNLLESPVKSDTQLKIEELQRTIKLASSSIEELKRPI